MRIKLWLITALLSLNMWAITYVVTRAGYQEAQDVGLIPNLHLHHKFGRLV